MNPLFRIQESTRDELTLDMDAGYGREEKQEKEEDSQSIKMMKMIRRRTKNPTKNPFDPEDHTE